jgi:methionyl-tRNA formyltransferase
VVIHGVHPAGKRPMSVEEFLRGHRIVPGERFGSEPPAAG